MRELKFEFADEIEFYRNSIVARCGRLYLRKSKGRSKAENLPIYRIFGLNDYSAAPMIRAASQREALEKANHWLDKNRSKIGNIHEEGAE